MNMTSFATRAPRKVIAVLKAHLLPHFLCRNSQREWELFFLDKTVAIVGPAPLLGPEQEHEIEAHDVIIRVGHEHWSSRDKPSRTDVWVLDGGASAEFLAGSLEPLASQWLLLKGTPPLSTLLRNRSRFDRVRFARRRLFPKISLFWNPNQVPVVAMELSFLKPRFITVFGSDFYTTPGQAYRSTSRAHLSSTTDWTAFRKRMFRSHDQRHQREVLKVVGRHWVNFEGDERFLRLMHLSDESFDELLDTSGGSN